MDRLGKFIICMVFIFSLKIGGDCKAVRILVNNKDCGRSDALHNRIGGGQNAKLGIRAWPWMAVLGFKHKIYSDYFDTTWTCSGSLISDRYVLTAAHCTADYGNYSLKVVRLGELNLNAKVDDGASPIEVNIYHIKQHELYNKKKFNNDVALLKLKEKVTFTPFIRPVCLPVLQQHKNKIKVKTEPYVAGWGFNGNEKISDALMEVQVPIVENLHCKKAYAKNNIYIDDNHLCAGKIGRDSCQGDSGGPLMLAINRKFYLVGIVNFGPRDCRGSSDPGVYARVTSFLEWIAKNMNSI